MQLLLTLTVLLAPAIAAAGPCESNNKIPARLIEPAPGIQNLVLFAKDLQNGKCWHTSPTAIAERHPPWSTFKIPHFLIALETGAVTSPSEVLRWDSQKRPAESYWPEAWKRDQSLRSAFEYSAPWPFQDLVPNIGHSNYTKWLEHFKFGNTLVPRGRDDFWLGGPLTISATEQVAFLSCLAVSGCGASAETVRSLQEAALQDDTGELRMYAKTGSGPVNPRDFSGSFEGWYVGYIRNGQGAPLVAFATYVRSDSYSALRTYRESASRHMLSELGYLPR